MSHRLDKEREDALQPKRIKYAVTQIEKLGFNIDDQTDTYIAFLFKGQRVTFFPYSGWFTGKTVKDGRGILNLLNQIK